MTDPLSHASRTSYDAAGNRTSTTDALGQTTTYTYDARDRLEAIQYSDGQTPAVAYTYTATGRRATMTDGTSTSHYTYDADRPRTVVNGAGQRVGYGYGYDEAGRITTLTYPDGAQVTRRYDALGQMTAVTDWLGHTTTFAYAAADNLVTQIYPNGVTVTKGYDAADAVTTIADARPTGVFWSFSYTRDPLGRTSTSSDPIEGQTHSYGYNSLDQLVSDRLISATAGTSTAKLYLRWRRPAPG